MPLKYLKIMDRTQTSIKKVVVLSRKLIVLKSGSSNLLEEITKSVVAFRMDIFEITSKEVWPKRRTDPTIHCL